VSHTPLRPAAAGPEAAAANAAPGGLGAASSASTGASPGGSEGALRVVLAPSGLVPSALAPSGSMPSVPSALGSLGPLGSLNSLPGRARRWPWVAAVLALAALGSGAYAVGADPGNAGRRAVAISISAAPSAGNRAIEDGAEDVALDRIGADGAFIVTVTGVRCGVEAVGPIELRRRVHEQFCLVGVSVENAGQEARPLDSGAQRAVDAHGRAYVVVGRAAMFLNERAPSLLDTIPGGATVRGVLPFAVPRRTHLVALLVHESAGTRGARIALS
jgi:hypothetical protein